MKKQSGFTLIELMIVITIIAILATIGVISFSRVQAQTRDTKRKADLRSLLTSMQAYFTEAQKYPTDAQGLAALVPTYIPTVPVDPGTRANYTYKNNDSNNTVSLCATLETATSSATTWKVSTGNPGGYATSEAVATCAAE